MGQWVTQKKWRRDRRQAEQGGKKSLGGILGLHQGTESPWNEERLGGEVLA